MTIAAGTRLGPYEVLAPLGAGGMGEVYRARDPRLNREVAVKVLPGDLLEGEERRARFEREANLLASLNHPGIAAIYSFEEIPSSSPSLRLFPLLVMELLEGETLRARLAGGALPVRKAVDYAAQIARGLAAAHGKGVVHRDLKPENLFVTKDGRVKILDFGLAKLVEPVGGSGATNLPTQSKGTEPGAVLGTIGLHVARAAPRPAGGPSDGPLQLRRRPLRDALGQEGVPRRHGRRHGVGDPARGPAGALRDEPDDPARARAHRAPLPREEPRRKGALRARPRVRPRVALDGVLGHRGGVGSPDRDPAASSRTLLAAAVCLGAGVLGGRLPLEESRRTRRRRSTGSRSGEGTS